MFVCVSVCWVRHLGGGLVEQSDNDVCLFVCLCVLGTLFRCVCVCLFEVPVNNF